MPLSRQKVRAIEKMVSEHPNEVLQAILEQQFWPVGLETGVAYSRESDDTDGLDPQIIVVFSKDADSWVEVTSKRSGDPDDFQMPFCHRFRSGFGGGRSMRVRNALMFLAVAIKLDSQDLPDRPKK